MEEIWDDLRDFEYLLMVSDGLVQFISSMSFGWILPHLKGQWLAAASGPSMVKGNFLCEEGDGMLSGALFLQ